MKIDSLWYDATCTKGGTVTITLRKCRNCGKTKVTSRPCSLDHLAAVMEFNAGRAGGAQRHVAGAPDD